LRSVIVVVVVIGAIVVGLGRGVGGEGGELEEVVPPDFGEKLGAMFAAEHWQQEVAIEFAQNAGVVAARFGQTLLMVGVEAAVNNLLVLLQPKHYVACLIPFHRPQVVQK
jgi:hypothetical protein